MVLRWQYFIIIKRCKMVLRWHYFMPSSSRGCKMVLRWHYFSVEKWCKMVLRWHYFSVEKYNTHWYLLKQLYTRSVTIFFDWDIITMHNQWSSGDVCHMATNTRGFGQWMPDLLRLAYMQPLPLQQNNTRATRTPAFWGYPSPPHDYPYYWPVHIRSQVKPRQSYKFKEFAKTSKFWILEKVFTCDTPSEVAW